MRKLLTMIFTKDPRMSTITAYMSTDPQNESTMPQEGYEAPEESVGSAISEAVDVMDTIETKGEEAEENESSIEDANGERIILDDEEETVDFDTDKENLLDKEF